MHQNTTPEFLNQTTSLCATCKRSLSATLFKEHNQIIMRKACPTHGHQEVLISSNAQWYDSMMAYPTQLSSPSNPHEVSQGCPFDCGPCDAHEQQVLLPIVPITSACNLSCPICYTHNKNDGAYHMSEIELEQILSHLKNLAPAQRIINLTGGEPTQHPDFERLIEKCQEEGINRVTLSTHGLKLINNEALIARLAKLDTRIILSFDSFEDPTNKAMLGGNFTKGKLKVLELLGKHKVNTTLLPVLARGLNDHELGKFVDLALSNDHIRSLELHTMTFTGQYGASFERNARYTTYDVLADLEDQTNGRLRISDFVPSPAAHQMCYIVTYLLHMDDGSWLPMTRFMPPADMRSLLSHSLYLEPDERTHTILQDVINRLWAGDIETETDPDQVLSTLKSLVRRIFAPNLTHAQRLRISEQSSKAIYIHAHMDEDNFDSDRIRQCCVSIANPDGSTIPSCAYNVLYRERDPKFINKAKAPVSLLGQGRIDEQ